MTQISFPLRRKAGTQTPRARGHSDRPSQAVIKVDSGDLPEKVFRQRKKVRGESLRVQVHERRKASEEPPQEGKWLFLLKKKKKTGWGLQKRSWPTPQGLVASP